MSGLPVGAIRFRGVSRSYRLVLERNYTAKETLLRRGRVKSRRVQALTEVDLDIEPGTAVGVVGSNGAGKSTMLKLISGILPPDKGVVTTSGRVVSLLELGAGFHPDFSGRENVILNASIHKISRRDVERRMDDIVAFSGLEKFIDAPVRTYSSGMYARLGFAVASQLDPDILLLDEILAVGDQEFQNRCIARIAQFKREGVTIVFVSHADGPVQMLCDRAIWLGNGRVLADGDVDEVLTAYHAEADGGMGQPPTAVSSDTTGSRKKEPEQDKEEPPTAAIHGIRVRSADGSGSGVRYGDPFRIDIDVRVSEPQPLVLGMELRSSSQALLASIDTRTPEPAPTLDVGMHRFTFHVDRSPIHEGLIQVHAGLSTPAGVTLGGIPMVDFQCVPTAPGVGALRFEGRWEKQVLEDAETVKASA